MTIIFKLQTSRGILPWNWRPCWYQCSFRPHFSSIHGRDSWRHGDHRTHRHLVPGNWTRIRGHDILLIFFWKKKLFFKFKDNWFFVNVFTELALPYSFSCDMNTLTLADLGSIRDVSLLSVQFFSLSYSFWKNCQNNRLVSSSLRLPPPIPGNLGSVTGSLIKAHLHQALASTL